MAWYTGKKAQKPETKKRNPTYEHMRKPVVMKSKELNFNNVFVVSIFSFYTNAK